MRAVVLEIREKKAAVMTLEGNVILVDDKGYVIGQEIDVRADEIATPGFSERFLRYIPAVAAAAVLLLVSAVSGIWLHSGKCSPGCEEAGKIESAQEDSALKADEAVAAAPAEQVDEEQPETETVVKEVHDIVADSTEEDADTVEEDKQDASDAADTVAPVRKDRKNTAVDAVAKEPAVPVPGGNTEAAAAQIQSDQSEGSDTGEQPVNNPAPDNGNKKKHRKTPEETAEADAPEPPDPTPVPTEPDPAPAVTEPTPVPVEPTPVVTEPTPGPVEPTPAVTEPTPEPTEPDPAPAEPTPTPSVTEPEVPNGNN